MITLNMTPEEFENTKSDLIEFLEVEKLLRRTRKVLTSRSEYAPEVKAEIDEALDWTIISVDRVVKRLLDMVDYPDDEQEAMNDDPPTIGE